MTIALRMHKGSSISNFSMKEPKIDTSHTTSMLLSLWQSSVKESCKKENLANNVQIAFLGLYPNIYKLRKITLYHSKLYHILHFAP